MSAQELDVRRSWTIIRRHRRVAAAIAAVGLAIGLGAALAFPPTVEAKALVALPPPEAHKGKAPPQDIDTQVLIAGSAPVLASAAQDVRPPLSTREIKDRIQVRAATQDIIEIRASGPSAREAKDLANAVAHTYVNYITDSGTNLPGNLGKKKGTRVLEGATTATSGSLAIHLALFGLLGTVAGGLVGSLGVLAAARGDTRLHLRSEIADAVGIPVLASVSSWQRSTNVSGWIRLFEQYVPTPVDEWSLRKALHHLDLDGKTVGSGSVAVISFAGDDHALRLGPQLATFTTSLGITTTLAVDTRHESTAALTAANQSESGIGGSPDVTSDLLVHVIVVDRKEPQLPTSAPTTATIATVSAGSVTADDLARLAVEAANGGRDIEGIVVIDPDPTDRTTGRVPRLMPRPASRPHIARRITSTRVQR